MPKIKPASPAQIAFVVKLAAEVGVAAPAHETMQEASDAITALKELQGAKKAEKFAAKKAAEADAMELVAPWFAGRQKFEGEIVMTKWSDGAYGCSLKCLAKAADGKKVWMTVPRNIEEQYTPEELKGVKISGVITLQPKEEEPWFAFGSRPANFKVNA